MVRKGNPKNIQAIDDVCGVRAVAGLGTVEEAMFRGLSDKCVAGGKPPLEIVTCPPAPYSTAQRFPDTSNFESLSEMLAAIDWDGRRQVLAVELANRESRSVRTALQEVREAEMTEALGAEKGDGRRDGKGTSRVISGLGSLEPSETNRRSGTSRL
jgi:hypothetical protein